MNRSRGVYLGLVVAVILGGLASRKWPIFDKHLGDALWAVMVFLLLGLFWPSQSTARLAFSALLISYLDEISQLYQAPWMNAIRATTLGHLALGSTFAWGDVLAYTVGVVVAALGEFAIRRRSTSTM